MRIACLLLTICAIGIQDSSTLAKFRYCTFSLLCQGPKSSGRWGSPPRPGDPAARPRCTNKLRFKYNGLKLVL
ncbi:hypothetical protein M430DRAFT_70024 [Amorphotheca resinae ATCC 22711]|uniref:Secreted protein n=1 Tax=Amorphotheca resinae ATCC 22711 TaxID=857342 RepID=A0A2T3AR94_AMORE|nr:hypothetical protein M430DRAFT_70024 [Amorphotheca resinae ATCC 22711]PSS08788.1 hypothetical protein M430DRAFT_70024 [Amorphotheca resinae ATCC 22711]